MNFLFILQTFQARKNFLIQGDGSIFFKNRAVPIFIPIFVKIEPSPFLSPFLHLPIVLGEELC
jgi:hypothetical protein